ncbi:hypothetical protein [Frisingicoccus sp.]|uniref:hypothetical protein n=2 Tax=Frisingicoccus sp. TaxID=1918627 RepID=UPI003AB13945
MRCSLVEYWLVIYNIEIAQHNWCCSEDCPCSQYYDGIIDRTTLDSYAKEDRFVFGVFFVDEAYEGDNRDESYVTTSSKYKLSLSLEEAKKILFWNYYHNENAPEKVACGPGLHRYITDVQAGGQYCEEYVEKNDEHTV